MQKAKSFQSQNDFYQAEVWYRHALLNFHDAPPHDSPSNLQGSSSQDRSFPAVSVSGTSSSSGSFGSIDFSGRRPRSADSSLPSCNCEHGAKCAETLKALLLLMYAQNKLTSALPIFEALLEYMERNASGPSDPALLEAKANYKKLFDKVLSNSRWPAIAPLFKQHKFIGMQRTRVHQILGDPNASLHKDSSGPGRLDIGSVPGVNISRTIDYPSRDLPNPGQRDYYVLSVVMPDPPVPHGIAGKTYPASATGNEGPYSFLDIDYADDLVVRYRLRTRDQLGKWVTDNSEPRLPATY